MCIRDRIMDLNSPAKHSRDSVINSKSKVFHQQHSIQLPTVLQKPSTRLLESYSRNLSQKANVTRQKFRRILMGLPHNSENSDKGYAVFFGVRMWSCTFTRNSNPIPPRCLDNQDDGRREASIVPPIVGSFRRQISASPTANRAISSPNFQSFQ